MTKPINKTPLTPEQYAEYGTEKAHCVALIMWARNKQNLERWPELKWLFHIPNGGLRTPASAATFKAMGVKSGVPDYCLPVRRGSWQGLWIEAKRPKRIRNGKMIKEGEATGLQDEWKEHMKAQGMAAITCVGYEELRDTIIAWLEWKET